jgi:general secretion pathway protein J
VKRARARANDRSNAGMVLVELLVAVAIFAVVAAVAYRGIASVTLTRGHLRDEGAKLGALQLAIATFERDLRQALPRTTRGSYGEVLPALSGDRRALEFSCTSFASPFEDRRAQIARVAYAVRDDAFGRAAQAMPDRGTQPPAEAKVLVEGIESIELRYLDGEARWVDAWPPSTQRSEAPERLPRAVELTLILENFGPIRRVIELVDTRPLAGVAP